MREALPLFLNHSQLDLKKVSFFVRLPAGFLYLHTYTQPCPPLRMSEAMPDIIHVSPFFAIAPCIPAGNCSPRKKREEMAKMEGWKLYYPWKENPPSEISFLRMSEGGGVE